MGGRQVTADDVSGRRQICISPPKQSVPPTLNDWASHLDIDRTKGELPFSDGSFISAIVLSRKE
jgi:hypothetical protein